MISVSKCMYYSEVSVYIGHTPLGYSTHSHALLRLVGGKELWKSVRAASSWCFENHGFDYWYFYARFLHVWNLNIVSVPFGDEVMLKWCGGLVARGFFFHLDRQSFAGNILVVLPGWQQPWMLETNVCLVGHEALMRLFGTYQLWRLGSHSGREQGRYANNSGELAPHGVLQEEVCNRIQNNDCFDAASTIWLQIFRPWKQTKWTRNRWFLEASVPR